MKQQEAMTAKRTFIKKKGKLLIVKDKAWDRSRRFRSSLPPGVQQAALCGEVGSF